MANFTLQILKSPEIATNFRYDLDFSGEEDHLSMYITKVDLKFTGKKVKADFCSYLPIPNLQKNIELVTSFNDVMLRLIGGNNTSSDTLHIYDISTDDGDRDVYTGVSSVGTDLMELKFSVKGTWDFIPSKDTVQTTS